MIQSLSRSGIKALYTHQFAAWEEIQAGHDVVIVTVTSSGKSLCYNLPVLTRLIQHSETRALYLFPTKALAQDQSSNLSHLSQAHAIYDGDTPAANRKTIRQNARIILTNPDMLHTGILPHHTAWAEFFQGLQFVVIDEMHVYRGVFGSHFANVLRRLKRIAAFYGSFPQFILTSASIGNPLELAYGLLERKPGTGQISLIDEDGSPHGERHFVIYNPPVVNRELGIRLSPVQEALRLASDLFANHIQMILFTRSRRSVEMLLTYLREIYPTGEKISQKALGGSNTPAIRGYRSGYLPRQRREIESGLRSGSVRAVVATNALELGIDIGQMGAALLVGYPGSIAGAWQQAGRTGRGTEPGLAVLIAGADPIDQFLAANPEYFFGQPHEQALIDPNNLLILLSHIRCAAFELPFTEGESFGGQDSERTGEFLEFLVEEGNLHHTGARYFWMADRYPAQDISLRSASTNNIALQTNQDSPQILGTVDYQSALWMVHPQAIYLHEGQIFEVEELDLERNIARLRPSNVDYFTEPRTQTTVTLVEDSSQQILQRAVPGGQISFGEIQVTSQVVGFRMLRWQTMEILGLGELDLPAVDLQTIAYWWAISSETIERLRSSGLWSSDPNKYGPSWPRQRDLARRRDNYQCQVCGTPESFSNHDVHHKTPFRSFDSPQAANQLDNLVTLCARCHRRVESAVRIRSGLAGLGFILSHLAPIFLMCDRSDLGVQSDPQSPLADGQPAIVIYDQVPAGVGFSKRLFDQHAVLVASAYQLVSACSCDDGCPSCVGPGGENGAGGKQETLAILKYSL